MRVTLDGEILFDEQGIEFEIGSISRECVERSVPGVNGVLSIDLGRRARGVKQKGVLRAASLAEMEEKTESISAFMDGKTHELENIGGRTMADLRLDSFKITRKEASGTGLCWAYEIVYTQLRV